MSSDCLPDGRRARDSFFFLVPWVDGLLLVAATAFFLVKLAVVPGQPVELPTAPFEEGARAPLSAVVCTSSPGGAPVVFFADERLLLSDPTQRHRLHDLLRSEAASHDATNILLYADRSLTLDHALEILSLFREAGLSRVSFVTEKK